MRTFHRTLAIVLGSLLMIPLFLVFPATAAKGSRGAVYTLSNDASGNAVEVFRRGANGKLAFVGETPTGGLGSGDGLGSQGALVLSTDGRWLVAVNAGSDTVSVFAADGNSLLLKDSESSGGERPISVTVHGRLIYALNDGSDSLSGLRLSPQGKLHSISGSTVGLSGTDIAPAQVQFTPDGANVVVTEKNTNLIDVFPVRPNGRLGAPVLNDSEGETPFGFAFDPAGRLIISEAFGGGAGASALSSYAIVPDGSLGSISASVPDGQSAACWVVITPSGRYAYTTNTGSNTISGYAIGSDGSLSLLPGDPFASGAGPIDASIAGGFLYALNAGSHDISAYSIGSGGSLSPIQGIAALPPAAAGLASQ